MNSLASFGCTDFESYVTLRMVWEVDTKLVGDWIEAKIVVARDDGDYSWVGQLMMRSDEWQDFASHLGLRESGNGVWRSG